MLNDNNLSTWVIYGVSTIGFVNKGHEGSLSLLELLEKAGDSIS